VLRLIVLLLMLLNMGYFAWSEGWLRAYGWAPVQQREPERLAQQINPQALTVLPQSAATGALGAVSAPAHPIQLSSAPEALASLPVRTCLQSNPLEAVQANVLRPVLQSQFEPDAWQLEERLPPSRWMLYMGKFANKAEQAKKRTQLIKLKVAFDAVEVAELEPGFSLGVFPTQKAAGVALAAMSQRGVRTARLVQVQDASPTYRLQLKAADPAQDSVRALSAALESLKLTPCAPRNER